jgi:hypothetical protein
MQRSAPRLLPPELLDMSLAAAVQQEGFPSGLNFSIRAELLAGPAEKQPGGRP